MTGFQGKRTCVRAAEEGFVLLSVVLAITLIALVAFMIGNQTTIQASAAAGELQRDELRYITEASVAHAKWQLVQNTHCSAYTGLSATAFGAGSYSATVSPSSGSPVSLVATGSQSSGASHSVSRDNIKVFQASTTLALQPDAVSGKDTYVYQWKSTWNYGAAGTLRVENRIAGDWANALFEFDLSTIPSAATIISATLELNQTSTVGSVGGDFAIHKVTRTWSEGTQTGGIGSPNWTERDAGVAWTTVGGDFDPQAVATISFSSGPGLHQWNISDLVQDWVSGTSLNQGLAVVPASWGTNAFFASSDNATAALRPKLTVVYACECGIGESSGSVILQPGVSGKEAMLRGTKNYGATPYTWIDTSVPFHSLYEFDLSGLPSGAMVTSALLDIHQSSADAVTVPADLDIHRATTAWLEGTGENSGISPPDGATWTSSDGTAAWTSPGGDYDNAVVDSVVIDSTGAAWHQWDITSLTQSWVDGTYPNFGVLLRASSGSLTKLYLDTGEDGNVNLHPKLSINFTCPCGNVCTVGGGSSPAVNNLLLVVDNSGSPSTQDIDKKALIESWNYTVTMISDGEPQEKFDTALGANEVVYVSGDVNATTVGTKLTAAAIGIVNEETLLTVEFGFSADTGSEIRNDIEILDNTHSITTGFTLGMTTIVTSMQPLNFINNGAAPGAQVLAQTNQVASFFEPSLLTLEKGSELSNGALAAGKRVSLPWGTSGFDINALNADGLTIMERAIEWAAAAGSGASPGPIAHWKLDETSGNTAVDSVGGHDGTLINGPFWTPGKINGGLIFDGVDDYIDASSLNPMSYDDFTVVAWYKSSHSSVSDDEYIFEHNDNFSYEVTFGPTDDGTAGRLRFGFSNGGPSYSTWDPHYGTSNIADQQWHHVVGVRHAGRIKLYVDGVLESDGPDAHAGATITIDGDGPFIGDLPGNTERVHGTLDDVRLYGLALSDSEIADLFIAGGGGGGESSLYVEIYHEWNSTVGGEWQVQDLSGIGVPPNAVVEVAMANGNPSFDRWVGLRAVGSGIDRRLQLAEAEAGGEDVTVMHVQANSSSQIEHYAETAGTELRFVLLGYWTAGTYVERFDVFTAGASQSWVERNLAPYGVGPGSVAEIVLTNKNPSLEREVGVRSSGSALNRRLVLQEAENGGVDGATMMVVADGSSNAAIQVAAEAHADTDFYLAGYWSSPPGTYVEAAGPIFDPSSPNGTWTHGSLSGSGAPANSTAQIAIMNGSSGREANLGVREVGSSQERWLDLREAEAGGRDIGVWHVNSDSSSAIEWYDERTSDPREFRVLGWWVASP